MVFHVTNRGYSSTFRAGEGCCERLGKENREDLDEDFESPPRAACEDVVEDEDGVETVETLDGEAA